MKKRHAGTVYGGSKGKAPGSKQYYKPIYSASKWDEFLRAHAAGDLLQVCCGGSFVGRVRIDLDPNAPSANVRADMMKLPFRSKSFDTVACDPMYDLAYPRRILLQRELFRVARKLVVFKAPWVPRGSGWKVREPIMGIFSHTCANVAVMVVLDRAAEPEDLF